MHHIGDIVVDAYGRDIGVPDLSDNVLNDRGVIYSISKQDGSVEVSELRQPEYSEFALVVPWITHSAAKGSENGKIKHTLSRSRLKSVKDTFLITLIHTCNDYSNSALSQSPALSFSLK
jgi:hypothetical protein